jgi:membrane associated rhomboid family serine protease
MTAAISPAPGVSRLLWPIWLLVGLTCLPEILLTLADHGIIGSTRWRSLAYQNGAFWAGLLQGWRPNYAAQPVTMFLTYAGLHAGPLHLAGNMAGLIWLGRIMLPDLGLWRFVLLYLGATVGGAMLFGLLSDSPAPMVGASGALFGLAGAWMVQEGRRDLRPMAEGGRGARAAWIWVGQMLGLMTAVNFASWVLQDGQLAWQTHLGGAVAGIGLAVLFVAPHRDGPHRAGGG